MSQQVLETRQDLLNEIKTLPNNLTKDVLEFICFVKARQSIDPTQAYFWTKKWQSMEKESDVDIKVGRVNRYKSIKEFRKNMGD